MKLPLQTVLAGTLAALIAAAAAAHAGITVSQAWTRRYSGPANNREYPSSLAIDPSGNVLITGRSWSEDGTKDAYTAKYAVVDGSTIWERRHDRLTSESVGWEKQLALDPNGNAIVAGYSNNGGTDGFRISKFAAADGVTLWERFLGEGTLTRDKPPVAVDADGNIVVAYRPGAESSFLIGKFAAADGALVWKTPFDELPSGVTYAGVLTLDASGNAIVSGTWQSDLGTESIYTAKYAAATGALLWENRFSNPPYDVIGRPTAVAVDGRNDVVVVGFNGESQSRGVIRKHASADGSVVWQTALPKDPATELTTAYTPADVAVDGAGNVFVASSVVVEDPLGLQHMFPVHTAKFAAADGMLQWERKHTRQHAEELIDMAAAIALDSFGNVVMGGWLFSAIYSPMDGAILWESPPFVGETTPVMSHLATGPWGMIAILGQLANDDIVTTVIRSAPFPPSFVGWVAGFGLGDAAPAGDPDADGVPNAVEYVLGGDPSSAARFGRSLNVVSTQPLVFSFLRDDASETGDVTLTVEAGTTLASWRSFVVGSDTASSSPGVSIAENGSDPDTVTLTLPTNDGTPQFARLAVTIAP